MHTPMICGASHLPINAFALEEFAADLEKQVNPPYGSFTIKLL